MPKTKFETELIITTHRQLDANGKEVPGLDIMFIPVHSFDVEGGANRKIDPASATEGIVFSEFEQARNYKTMIFYIPPTKDFLALKLMNLATRNWQLFDFIFSVKIFLDGKLSQLLSIVSRAASLRETPVPVGGTPALMRLKVRVKDPGLQHGQVDPKTKEMVNSEM
jgi:hypothetical protein